MKDISQINEKKLIEETASGKACVPILLVKKLEKYKIIKKVLEYNLPLPLSSLMLLKHIRTVLSKKIWKDALKFHKYIAKKNNEIENDQCSYCNRKKTQRSVLVKKFHIVLEGARRKTG